ncbi:retrovirus-related pol polyprotein from transposon TNT 1-94 [Tanacetum coccineum]
MADAEKTAALKTDVYKKAHSALLLCLDNKVLREVNKEDSAAGVWLKLESLYMTKSLANKLYLKKKLFTFYMHSGKKLSEHIDEFNKLIGDLANIGRGYDAHSLLTLEDVLSSLNSRELKKRTDAKDDGDGLYVRGRSDHQGNQGRGSSRSKSKGKGTYKRRCYICYSKDHLKKDCPKKNKKKSTGFVKKNVGQGSGSEGYDNGDLLMAVSEERFLEWIMDSGGSFHMTPRRDFLFDFKEFNGGTVLLGDNRACAIMGIGKVRVQMKDGTYEGNCVYSWMAGRNGKSECLGIQERKSCAGGAKTLGHISESGLHELEKKEVIGNKGIEATVTAAYPINCYPSIALEKKTPMDLWSGYPANYKMLRIFSCVAYSHVNQGKLKPRAIKCIFLGYPEGVKGYRLWRLDDVKPKIIISRDVVFNKSLMYKDTLKGTGVADSGKEVEFEVELQGSRAEPTMDPHTGKNPRNEDEEQNEGPQQHNLDNYVLGRLNSSEKDEWALDEDYELEQLDVKTAFLHGNLEETIYMRQPPGFEEGTGNKVCLLKKSLYGLKQSPRQWYKRFDVYMISNGFSRNNYDSCVYFKEFAPGMYIYLLLYVDDMLIACKSKSEIEYTKGLLRKEFDMKELGPARKILGMEIVRDRGSRTLKVSQSGYVQKILNNYRMDNGKSVSVPLGAHFKVSLKDCPSNDWDVERMSKVPYANVVGSLMYLMVCTRPDIAYAVSIVSSAIHLSRNAMFHERTKHINVRYHFIREIVESKEIEVAKIGTKDNAADAFTKVVPGPKFKYCMKILGVGIN